MNTLSLIDPRSRVKREDSIRKLVDERFLTPDGADWLVLRTDPYHDFPRPVAGYPDADNFSTVVEAFNYELNVSKPTGAAGNWDAHVFTLPLDYQRFENCSTAAGWYQPVPFVVGKVYDLGLVNLAKADAGQPLFPNTTPIIATNFSCEAINQFAGVTDGFSRVIGLGIEIIDTTAQLYKQGSLTVYKAPAYTHQTRDIIFNDNTGAVLGQDRANVLYSPPARPSEAVIFKATLQWEAKEGVYITVGQDSIENDFTAQIPARTVFHSAAGDYLISVPEFPAGSVLAPDVTPSTGRPVKRLNVSQHGVFLSGLHNDATFKIRTRVYIERAPAFDETTLVPLVSPSAAFDSRALQMYSHVSSLMPAGVHVSANAAGDWWRIMRSIIIGAAPIVGAALTPVLGPGSALVGTAVSKIVGALPDGKKRIKPKAKAVKRA